ncbi:MAG: peptidylprolyl isomerase [Gemmatimonadaceae bacterium]
MILRRLASPLSAPRPLVSRALIAAVVLLGATGCATLRGPVVPPPPPPITPPMLAASDSFLVRMETSKGAMDLMVRTAWAPRGAAQLGELVLNAYYDGGRFFRVLPGFVVQWGLAADPATTATWLPRRIPDDPLRETNRRGTVTYAMGGRDTRTTQLFINLRDNARLDGMGFAPVGEIVAGLAVVDSLYAGYGEGAPMGKGPAQDRITTEGESYLAAQFPLLDRVVTMRVLSLWPDPRSLAPR